MTSAVYYGSKALNQTNKLPLQREGVGGKSYDLSKGVSNYMMNLCNITNANKLIRVMDLDSPISLEVRH